MRHRVDELIELLGLEAFRSKFVRELSTGSRRVVDLACVVAHRPSVVLLDEPSSGIAQREAEALGPLLLRIRDDARRQPARHRARHAADHRRRPTAWSPSTRAGCCRRRTPTRCSTHPEVVASYLGDTEAVIARSGASTTT